MTAGDALSGDSVPWSIARQLEIAVDGLLPGDVVQVVTASGSAPLLEAPALGSFRTAYPLPAPRLRPPRGLAPLPPRPTPAPGAALQSD